MKLDLQKKLWYPIFLLLFCLQVQAQLYWKSSGGVDQTFTNSANWETAPGNGLNPSGQPPTLLIDAIFPASVNTQTINFNGGFCRNLNLSALPAANIITITGSGTISGSVIASNGNLRLNTTTVNYSGSGSKTLDFGTPSVPTTPTVRGNHVFDGNGTYSLVSNLYDDSAAFFKFDGNVNFSAIAKTIKLKHLRFNETEVATSARNVSFTNCSITTSSVIYFAINAFTTSSFSGSDIILEDAGNQNPQIRGSGITIKADSRP